MRGLRLEGAVVEVAYSAASSVIVPGRGSAAVALHGHSMKRARVGLDARCGASLWLRVTVIDAARRRAW